MTTGRPARLILVAIVAAAGSALGVLATEPVPLGPAFLVSSGVPWGGSDVEITRDGEFLVVWTENGTDGSQASVLQRRFDRRGVPFGPPVVATVTTAGNQADPRVSARSSGEYVVAWESDLDIVARRFARDGSAAGSEIVIDSTGTSRHPDVTMGESGEFVVAWGRWPSYFTVLVEGQRVDKDDAKIGSTFEVLPATPSRITPNVSIAPVQENGEFVVAFSLYAYALTTSTTQFMPDTWIRRMDASGAGAAPAFKVNAGADVGVYPPAVDSDRLGNFVVVWEEDFDYYFNPDADAYLRRFDASGSALAPKTLVEADSLGQLDVSSNLSGDFVVAWRGDGDQGDPVDVLVRAHDRLGVPQGPAQPIGLPDSWVVGAVDLDEKGQIVLLARDATGFHARQYCWDDSHVLVPTRNPNGRLHVLEVPGAASHASVPLVRPGTTAEGAGLHVTPMGRRALVSVERADERRVFVRSVEIGSGLVTAELTLGPESRLVPGVELASSEDTSRAVLVTEDPLAGSVSVRSLAPAALSVESLHVQPDARALPFAPPLILADDATALVAIEDTATGRGTVLVTDLASGTLLRRLDLDAGERFVGGIPPVLLPHEDLLTASQEPGTGAWSLRRWDVGTGVADWRLDFSPAETLLRGTALQVTADGSLAVIGVSGDPGRLHVVDLDAGLPVSSVSLGASLRAVESVPPVLVSDESEALWSVRDESTGDTVLYVVDLATVSVRHTVSVSGTLVPGIGPVPALQGTHVLQATDGSEPRLHVIDRGTGGVVQSFLAPTSRLLVRGVAPKLTPESAYAIWPTSSASFGAEVRVIDLTGPSLLATTALGTSQQLVPDVDVELSRCGFTAVASTRGRFFSSLGRTTMIDVDTGLVSGTFVYESQESSREGLPPLFPPSVVLGDCNANLVRDADDITSLASQDCDANGIPDECEPDCNANGAADACDIATSFSDDCDLDGVPDECQPDCNLNGVADACDISGGGSSDCSGNGIPDECEPDCNMSSQPDSCEVFNGILPDCNGDEIPDGCQVGLDSDGDGVGECQDNCPHVPNPGQADADIDGLGDACESDADGDGIADALDNCPLAYNPDQGNADGDHLGDACDACASTYDPPTVDGDSDGVGDGCDCAASDGTSWLRPTEVLSLRLSGTGATSLSWTAPREPGADALLYDVLRSPSRDDFVTGAVCLESDDADLAAVDPATPPAGQVFYYLARAVNACPGGIGEGDLGSPSGGGARSGRSCP